MRCFCCCAKPARGEDVYLHLQLSDEGWNYTLYSRTTCHKLDGGQFEAGPLPDALQKVVDLHLLVIGPVGLITMPLELLESIQEAARANSMDDLVSVTLSKADWMIILDALDLAIDDRHEMAAYADDQEDTGSNNACADALDDLHAKISECVYRRK